MMLKKVELLSPAGNMEKLKAAVTYGADAVYFGGEAFGLRAHAGNFTLDEMKEALKYLHSKGKKGYLTINAYARDEDIEELKDYLIKAASIGVDAFIISDPGVFYVAKDVAPKVERHISTQANTTNSLAVKFWKEMGASRVILARELSKNELFKVAKEAPCEVEAFVHGAICISYSGRCMISAYMTGRDANKGECTQPCRWNYVVKEATRPEQDMPIEEDASGTYLYNAKDLCLINRVGELVEAGISSLKIEGRMKSVMYVAVVTAVYRKAIDTALADPDNFVVDPNWQVLLDSVSNRHYTEGFYAGVPDRDSMNYDTSAYVRNSDFLGVITDINEEGITIECRGKFNKGEILEILTPELNQISFVIDSIVSKREGAVENSKPNEIFIINGDINMKKVTKDSLLRRIV